MPLVRHESRFRRVAGGVSFLMRDTHGRTIRCLVTTQALEAAAIECGVSEHMPTEIFARLRRSIEQCAGDKYEWTQEQSDSDEPDGLVLVGEGDLLQ